MEKKRKKEKKKEIIQLRVTYRHGRSQGKRRERREGKEGRSRKKRRRSESRRGWAECLEKKRWGWQSQVLLRRTGRSSLYHLQIHSFDLSIRWSQVQEEKWRRGFNRKWGSVAAYLRAEAPPFVMLCLLSFFVRGCKIVSEDERERERERGQLNK